MVQELIDEGLIRETKKKLTGKRGRPVKMLEFWPRRIVCISIYPEDYSLIGSLVDMADNTLAETEVFLPPDLDNQRFLDVLDSFLRFLVSKVPPESALIGAGISLIGIVDENSKIWVGAARWPHIKNIAFASVENNIGIPIALKRWLDTELEYQLMQVQEGKTGNSLLFHWGMGLGAAFSHKGQVINSRFGIFTDTGHIIVDPNSKRVCHCGQKGCLEAIASTRALLPVFRKEYPAMQASNYNVKKALAETGIYEHKEFRYALDMVKKIFADMLRLLYPDRIFFIGPFLQDARIAREFTQEIETFSQGMYGGIRYQISAGIIHDQLHFCKIANVRPFFEEKLRSLLGRNGFVDK
jgi:transcriptional regulator of PTS gene